MTDDAFVARNAPVRVLLLAALAAGFVAIGLWIVGAFGPAPDDAPRWAGWLSIAFFGPGCVLILARLFQPSEQLRIDRDGIRWRQWSDDLIPWSAVRAIEQASVHNQKFLCLRLDQPERYRSTQLLGRLGGANRALGFGDIAISVTGTDRSFDDLVRAVGRFAPSSLH